MGTELMEKIKKSWNDYICYPKNVIRHPIGSRLFFIENRQIRYEKDNHEYILKIIEGLSLKNKKVLEIGCGVGEDLVQIAKRGAICYGIDLTENAVQLTMKNCEFNNVQAYIEVCDSSKLPYDDSYFDIVYSMGVLHHSPDIETKIAEIYRILKKGGMAIIMLYNKNFFTYQINLLLIRHLLGMKFLSQPFEKTKNDLEYKSCPYTMLYSKKDCRKIFSKFSKIDFQVEYFRKAHLRILGYIIPQSLLTRVGKTIGFHRIIFATK